jgi:hypothetical protein
MARRPASDRGMCRSPGYASSSCCFPAACSASTSRAVCRKCTFSSSIPCTSSSRPRIPPTCVITELARYPSGLSPGVDMYRSVYPVS